MTDTPYTDAIAHFGHDRDTYATKMTSHARALERSLAAAHDEMDALKRGEFICQKCGLRKDADPAPADF